MGGAQETEIAGFGAAAERERNDVIDLQQMPGAATASAAPGASFGAEGRVVAPGRFTAVAPACSQSASFGDKACAFAAEVMTPAGMAFRCAAAPALGPVASFGAEVSPTPTVGAAFRCADVASDLPASFGAEVSAAPPATARLPVRRPRGGRAGSWRSTASRTTRPRSCPNVRRGSTCDSSPLSCSNPLRQSSSITALSSHRSAPSGRIRSAGAVNSGSTPASSFSTCRVLLPAACSTSACRAEESSTGAACGSSARSPICAGAPDERGSAPIPGAGPLGAAAGRTLACTPRPPPDCLRSCRSKAFCNSAAELSVSEPFRIRSRAPSTSPHSRIALMRRHAAASL